MAERMNTSLRDNDTTTHTPARPDPTRPRPRPNPTQPDPTRPHTRLRSSSSSSSSLGLVAAFCFLLSLVSCLRRRRLIGIDFVANAVARRAGVAQRGGTHASSVHQNETGPNRDHKPREKRSEASFERRVSTAATAATSEGRAKSVRERERSCNPTMRIVGIMGWIMGVDTLSVVRTEMLARALSRSPPGALNKQQQ